MITIIFANGHAKFTYNGKEFECTLTTKGIEVKETMTGTTRVVPEFKKVLEDISNEIINDIHLEDLDHEKKETD